MKRSNKQSPSATKLFDHMRELRTRFFICFAVLIVSGSIAYFFYEPILLILRSPLNAPLYYSNPAGSFSFIMKICFMGAIAVTIPVIIYNLIMFVRPAFDELMPLKRVYRTTALSVVMAIAGAVFAFNCILPGTLRFFGGFQISGLSALISADSYLNFVTNMIITFVIVFQIPLLIALIDSVKPIPPKKMLGMEKWVILFSLIVAALVPFAFDLMTCLLIALPIVVLYNLSIILVIIQHAHKKRATSRNSSIESVAKPQNYANKSYSLLGDTSGAVITKNEYDNLKTAGMKRAGMDIRPINRKPPVVKPAEWFIKHQQKVILINKRSRTISDVNHCPNINKSLI